MGFMKDGLKGYALLVVAAFAIAALVGALMYTGLLVKPAFLGLERTAYKESFQYTEAKGTELLAHIDDYYELQSTKQQYIDANATKYAQTINNLDIQQKALLDRIHDSADLVNDQNDLPASVQKFLRENPRTGRR